MEGNSGNQEQAYPGSGSPPLDGNQGVPGQQYQGGVEYYNGKQQSDVNAQTYYQSAPQSGQNQQRTTETEQQIAGTGEHPHESDEAIDRAPSYIRRGTYVGEGQDYWSAEYRSTDATGGFTKVRSKRLQPENHHPLKSILSKGSTMHRERSRVSFGPDEILMRPRSWVYSEEKNGFVDSSDPSGPVEPIVQLDKRASVNRTIVDEIDEKRRQRKLSQVEILWDLHKQRSNAGINEGWTANLGMPRVAMTNLPPRYEVKYPEDRPRSVPWCTLPC